MNSISASVDLPSPKSVDSGGRIMAWKKHGISPFINAPMIGGMSPSKSLLVERHDSKKPLDLDMFVHTDQVVGLYLTPSTVLDTLKDGSVSEVAVEVGEVFVCMRGRPRALHWKAAVNVLCVRVSDEALAEASHSIFGRSSTEITAALHMKDSRIRNLLYTLEVERGCGYPSGQLFLDSIETALAALLVSSSKKTLAEKKPAKGGLIPRRLSRVVDFMHANIDRQIRLSELARCAGMSLSHFSHQFRASTNTSPYQYMLSLRIDRSKKMLRNANLSVLDVALATGFENPQHFATVFRRIVGISPSDYRRQG